MTVSVSWCSSAATRGRCIDRSPHPVLMHANSFNWKHRVNRGPRASPSSVSKVSQECRMTRTMPSQDLLEAHALREQDDWYR